MLNEFGWFEDMEVLKIHVFIKLMLIIELNNVLCVRMVLISNGLNLHVYIDNNKLDGNIVFLCVYNVTVIITEQNC